MKGHYNDGFGFEWAEVNGSAGISRLSTDRTQHNPYRSAQRVAEIGPRPGRVPRCQRELSQSAEGVPSTVFRYDLVWEFVSAIVEGRDAVPGFDAGARRSLWRTRCSNRSRSRPGSRSTADWFRAPRGSLRRIRATSEVARACKGPQPLRPRDEPGRRARFLPVVARHVFNRGTGGPPSIPGGPGSTAERSVPSAAGRSATRIGNCPSRLCRRSRIRGSRP